ncbi:hypothetical protein QQ045_019473 [Rhodiola kirilowii]
MDDHVWPVLSESPAPCGEGCPLEADTLLISADGSWNVDSILAGMGTVAKDRGGAVMWTLALWSKSGCCSGEVEGLALLHAVLIMGSSKIKKAWIQTDSTEVYKAITSGLGIGEWCCSWLEEVLELLNANSSWRVCLIRREDNSLADLLASKARRESWTWDILVSIPRCISGLM